jgi:hypothetical protein
MQEEAMRMYLLSASTPLHIKEMRCDDGIGSIAIVFYILLKLCSITTRVVFTGGGGGGGGGGGLPDFNIFDRFCWM